MIVVCTLWPLGHSCRTTHCALYDASAARSSNISIGAAAGDAARTVHLEDAPRRKKKEDQRVAHALHCTIKSHDESVAVAKMVHMRSLALFLEATTFGLR